MSGRRAKNPPKTIVGKTFYLLGGISLTLFAALWPGFISEIEWETSPRKPSYIESSEISPNGSQLAYFETHDEKSDQRVELKVIKFANSVSQTVFLTDNPSQDIRSSLHWLGNDHVFFLRTCGSSCQGLTFLNVRTQQIKTATLSFPWQTDKEPYTDFID